MNKKHKGHKEHKGRKENKEHKEHKKSGELSPEAVRQADSTEEENKLVARRRDKLVGLRARGEAYPNDFRRDSLAAELHQKYSQCTNAELEPRAIRVAVAGRMVLRRVMGRASFATLQDMSGQIQLYLREAELPADGYDQFKDWDLGDILGAAGTLFVSKTGELSIQVQELRLLVKALRPLPEKHRGLVDREMRYRQRYLDLIANRDSREIFRTRARVVDFLRAYLVGLGCLEVETPMMQQLPGGAAARPFATHHNALDMPLFLRVAPELNLKRLVVGGFERVFEINRNFRNEGLSPSHNPEFTMLEFYLAYADYRDLMALTEELLGALVVEILGDTRLCYQGLDCDFKTPFARLPLEDALALRNPELTGVRLRDRDALAARAGELGIAVAPDWGAGKLQLEIFESTVEPQLIEPTFITAYPVEVSPLARPNDQDPFVADRFELFAAGRELANGFSELNDPEEQARRFRIQGAASAAGDEEAMPWDQDYLVALEYGLPPTAGEGMGIDRLVMLLTDRPSIRDVLLFPLMRPED